MKGWIGVDLDGTLARYDGWKGPTHIGEPIPLMVMRVKQWLSEGTDVRIFTARVHDLERNFDGSANDADVRLKVIQDWCLECIGVVLPVTCKKDYGMIELWDDRAVQVVPNTGEMVSQEVERLRAGIAAVIEGVPDVCCRAIPDERSWSATIIYLLGLLGLEGVPSVGEFTAEGWVYPNGEIK